MDSPLRRAQPGAAPGGPDFANLAAVQPDPKAIVRGIQLGVGVKLAFNGLFYLKGLPLWGIDSVVVAVLLIGILIISLRSNQPVLLYVFLAGFFIQYVRSPDVFSTIQMTFPHFRLYWPYPSAWVSGFLKGALPQVPLTLLNSVVAVCALSADYFPGKGIPPKKMAASVGWMNLICVPLGGIPMCHGAGGLAAQYRFGARTVIWFSILGSLPFTLLMPYADLFWTQVLSAIIGLVLASAFPAIVVFAQELVPGRVGLIAKGATIEDLKIEAVKRGMKTMIDDGLLKLGDTTLAEILRVVPHEMIRMYRKRKLIKGGGTDPAVSGKDNWRIHGFTLAEPASEESHIDQMFEEYRAMSALANIQVELDRELFGRFIADSYRKVRLSAHSREVMFYFEYRDNVIQIFAVPMNR